MCDSRAVTDAAWDVFLLQMFLHILQNLQPGGEGDDEHHHGGTSQHTHTPPRDTRNESYTRVVQPWVKALAGGNNLDVNLG